jgi:hypothetical protein
MQEQRPSRPIEQTQADAHTCAVIVFSAHRFSAGVGAVAAMTYAAPTIGSCPACPMHLAQK